MDNSSFETIFKSSSRTFYYSSLFFPSEIKRDVFILYSFVRTVDNFVDCVPQQKDSFFSFVEDYYKTLNKKSSNNIIIHEFVRLMIRKKINREWVDAFIEVMKQDLTKKVYRSMNDTLQYMYGSAEVIGLMMATILELPKQSYASAALLGRSMQYINFIRDIQEDLLLGRTYFPLGELKQYHLTDLTYESTSNKKTNFEEFIRKQINTYTNWQKEAESGFSYIPYRYRVPIKTASDLYNWTANEINKNPFVVYQKKVKPTIPTILQYLTRNSVYALFFQ